MGAWSVLDKQLHQTMLQMCAAPICAAHHTSKVRILASAPGSCMWHAWSACTSQQSVKAPCVRSGRCRFTAGALGPEHLLLHVCDGGKLHNAVAPAAAVKPRQRKVTAKQRRLHAAHRVQRHLQGFEWRLGPLGRPASDLAHSAVGINAVNFSACCVLVLTPGCIIP